MRVLSDKNIFMKVQQVFLLLRINQWLKNTFIFLPLFFGRQLAHWDSFFLCVIAFVSYSLAASSIYCFNDIYDVENDRKHPQKCKRPIASGRVSVGSAYWLMSLCAVLSLLTTFLLDSTVRYTFILILVCYYVMNLSYSLVLKKIIFVDVFIIAMGFVLRVLAGGAVTGVVISHWIVLMTFLLALFIALAKRRDDVVVYEETGVNFRKNTNRYNLQFMNQAISIIASITMMCYIMYTVSEEVIDRMQTSYLYVTSIFVLAGIMRYLQLTIVDVKSGSPTKVLMTDRFVQCCIVGWVLTFFLILYC